MTAVEDATGAAGPVHARARLARLGKALCVFALLLGAVLALQWRSGAWRGEFGLAQPDEAAHYVTGLMIHDWALAGFPAPLPYATRYYVHYPKVAFGMWPPLFHCLEAGWMLIWGESRGSVMTLMGLISAALGLMVFLAGRRELSTLGALSAALLLVTSRVIQNGTTMVMLDTTVALACWLATLAMVRFMCTNRTRDVLLVLAFASAAALTKGNGLCLGLTLPLTALLSGRPAVLLRWRLWMMAAGVALAAGPSQLLTLHLFRVERFHLTRESVVRALTVDSRALVFWFGPILFVLVVAGIVHQLILPLWRGRVEPLWGASGSLLIGGFAFHCLLPWPPDERYLAVVGAPLVLFLAAGVRWAAQLLPLPQRWRTPALTAAVVAFYFLSVFQVPHKLYVGYGEAAAFISDAPAWRSSVVLIASSGNGEGPFVSEMAMHRPRSGRVILRAGKMLGSSTWGGRFYTCLYRTPQEMQAYLEASPVDLVVIDNMRSPHPAEHHQVLRETLNRYSDRWQLAATLPREPAPDAPGLTVQVYRRSGPVNVVRRPIEIPMPHTLGRSIVY